MRISERGQVTIPKKIRDQFGLGPNTEVEFVVSNGQVVLKPNPRSKSDKIDAIYGKASFEYSTDELMRLLRS